MKKKGIPRSGEPHFLAISYKLKEVSDHAQRSHKYPRVLRSSNGRARPSWGRSEWDSDESNHFTGTMEHFVTFTPRRMSVEVADGTCDHQLQGQPSSRRQAHQNAAVYSGAAPIGHLYIHGLVCRVLQERLRSQPQE